MALNRPAMARVSGTDEKPATFKVIGTPCQLRPGPNFDYFSIGLIRKGSEIKGIPFILSGTSWIKLADEDAAIHVPDPVRREDGVWLPQVHPKYGRLVQSTEEDVRYGAPGSKAKSTAKGGQELAEAGPVEGGLGFGKRLTLKVLPCYEEMLQAEWTIEDDSGGNPNLPQADRYTSAVFEMVIDLASGQPPLSGDDPLLGPDRNGSRKTLLRPAAGAIVKRVPVGRDMKATVSNMPDSRYFLVSVVATFDGQHKLRSRWVRAATLNVQGRDNSLGNTDPGGNVRGKCEGKNCACSEFVPLGTWSLNSDPTVPCRRCGCPNDLHAIVGRSSHVGRREVEHTDYDEPEDGVGLPREAKDWDEREKNLWFWSNGALHPRENTHAKRKRKARTVTGNVGRVSVVCPTMEERQVFHEQVWSCFVNQDWPDKELIVIETYQTRSSDFFRHVAAQDDRLVYLKFRCGQTTELSIGSKRNIAQHIATGDYIANCDDDDIYAPTYLSTMIKSMNDQHAAFVTLANWYFFDIRSGRFGFFDAMEYAKAKRMSQKDIDGWLWGYGFSYLHKLQPVLDKKMNYPDQNMEEDIKYIRAFKETFGDQCTVLHFDTIGIVSHTLHDRNTSNCFALREVPREEMWDTDIAERTSTLATYLGMFPRQEERSRFIEYEAATDHVERRQVDRRVHWLRGEFTIRTTRGAVGYEVRRLCAEELGQPMSGLRLHRRPPEGGFVDLRRPDEERPAEPPAPEVTDQQPNGEPERLFFEVLLGTWVYGTRATEYVLSATGDGQMRFDGPHSRVRTVHGIFKWVGSWAVADLLSPDGEKVGSIRVKYVPEADKMISNFRSLTREDWGKDIQAQRKPAEEEDTPGGSPSSGGDSPKAPGPPPAGPQPQLPPSSGEGGELLRDEERVGAYVEELWLVITSKEVLEEVHYGPISPPASPRTPRPQAAEAPAAPAQLPAPEPPLPAQPSVPEPAAPAQPVEEPPAQPAEEPASKPVEEPAAQPVEEPASKPVEEPASKPAEEPVSKPASKPAEEPASKPAEEPASKPAEEPAEEPAKEPVEKPTVEPARELAKEEKAREPEELLDVVVHIDQALNLRELLSIPKGTSILSLKEVLATRDITGMSKADDFKLAWEPRPTVELNNSYKLKGDRTEFVVM